MTIPRQCIFWPLGGVRKETGSSILSGSQFCQVFILAGILSLVVLFAWTGSHAAPFMSTPGTMSGAADTWLGNSNQWTSAGNWSSGSVPDGSGSILIPSSLSVYPVIQGTTVTISGTGSLTIETGASLTVSSGSGLTLASGSDVTTTGSGKIALQSGASYVNLGNSAPALEMQRILDGGKGWYMLSSPLVTTYNSMFASPLVTQGYSGSSYPALQPNLLTWAENDGGTTLQSWRTPPSQGSGIPAGTGHLFYIFNGAAKPSPLPGNYTDALPATLTLAGTENFSGSGSFNFQVTKTARTVSPAPGSTTDATAFAANEGWNLVGNPTASTIDWDAAAGWTKTNIDQTIYIWDPGSASYLVWNGSAGSLGSGRIAPFQAFWVKANAASPALSLNNGAKTSAAGTFYKNASVSRSVTIPLTLGFSGMKTTSFICLDEKGIAGEDPMDGYRLQPMTDTWVALYTNSSPSSGLPLVINNLPLDSEGEQLIPLHAKALLAGQSAGGNFTLEWEIPANWPADLTLTLMDHSQRAAINMLGQNSYPFSLGRDKKGVTAAVDPLELPAAPVQPAGTVSGLKSAQPQPFTIRIGKGSHSGEAVYLEPGLTFASPAPNPFTDRTTLSFRLPEADHVHMEVFNSRGQLLETLVDGEYFAGLTTLDWYTGSLPPGIYLVKLTNGTKSLTIKGIKETR